MNNCIRLVIREDTLHARTVADVHLLECVGRLSSELVQRMKVGRISELVDIDDGAPVSQHEATADRRTDEACPACHQHTHQAILPCYSKTRPRSASIGSPRSFSDKIAAAEATGHSIPNAESTQLTPPS